MEFRDLQKQYHNLKPEIDNAVLGVLQSGKYISGEVVTELEERLSKYVGCKYCITCANGTDALELALRAIGIGEGDAVFVPDFTFFASGEVVAAVGAMPVFVDVRCETYNLSAEAFEHAVKEVIAQGVYAPKAVIIVDLFGQPAEYPKLSEIAREYGLYIIEDGAQGFGGKIKEQYACGFGDISTTSFFPAKPLGCYGDGGAVFTNNDRWNQQIRSLAVHGKSPNGKYDNIQVGMNSRLDNIQAAILQVKLDAFQRNELEDVNELANQYSNGLKGVVGIPAVLDGYQSSWAQYTIRLTDERERNLLQKELHRRGIPTMIYYIKPMHAQYAFAEGKCLCGSIVNAELLCNTVLSLPVSPYMTQAECGKVINSVCEILSLYRGKGIP